MTALEMVAWLQHFQREPPGDIGVQRILAFIAQKIHQFACMFSGDKSNKQVLQMVDFAPWLVPYKERVRIAKERAAQQRALDVQREDAVVSDMQRMAQMMSKSPNWRIQDHGDRNQ